MRRPVSGRLAAALAMALLLPCAGRAEPAGPEAAPLADGGSGPLRAGGGGSLTDREAARRRFELLRSPYTDVAERRSHFGGEVSVGSEAAVPAEVREAASLAVEAVVRDVLDRDGWTRPFGPRSPLGVLLVHPRADVPALIGWDGREKGRLVRPVVAVGTWGRTPDSVAFDVARSVALLAVRQAGPDEAGWAVEGLAELLAQEALGRTAPPGAGASPFLAARGSLARPAAAALFLREASRLSASGRSGLRAAWEETGALRGDDAEAFFRAVAREAEGGAPGLLAALVVSASAGVPSDRDEATGRLPAGERMLAAPGPLGWTRATFSSAEERGGLEVALPEALGARGARAALVYRPHVGEPDALPLAAGASRVLPLAGTEALTLVLVDGPEEGEATVRFRRVPGFPAILSSSSAEWGDGAVHLSWRTSSHQELLAWVVSRLREEPDGGLVLDGREVVPTTDASDESAGYLLVDREARPGTRYLYRVAALTRDGLLSESFEAAVETVPAP